jgi:arsenite methyltransferase
VAERKVEEIREAVRESYARRALKVSGGCCDPVSRGLYGEREAATVPAGALEASLGCGNPTALAELRPGETVLDLGSGGGIDVLLAAARVGPAGFAYGLDMTDEMLALAERNRAAAGAGNVRFLKGTIEEIPLPDASVDVVVSNCVVNLSGDKARVIREAFRVLRPGGRLAISDVLVQGEIPPALRDDMASWAGCIAGAMEESEVRRALADAGFADVGIRVTRVYDPAEFGGRFVAAFVRAGKPRA